MRLSKTQREVLEAMARGERLEEVSGRLVYRVVPGEKIVRWNTVQSLVGACLVKTAFIISDEGVEALET